MQPTMMTAVTREQAEVILKALNVLVALDDPDISEAQLLAGRFRRMRDDLSAETSGTGMVMQPVKSTDRVNGIPRYMLDDE